MWSRAIAWVMLGCYHQTFADVASGTTDAEEFERSLEQMGACANRAIALDADCADPYSLLAMYQMERRAFDEAVPKRSSTACCGSIQSLRSRDMCKGWLTRTPTMCGAASTDCALRSYPMAINASVLDTQRRKLFSDSSKQRARQPVGGVNTVLTRSPDLDAIDKNRLDTNCLGD